MHKSGEAGSVELDKPELITKITLTLIFLIGTGWLAWITGFPRLSQILYSWSTMDFLLLSLTTFRLGRLVAHDRVMEPFRKPFVRTVYDRTGAGKSVKPKGKGARQAIGQMLTCPVCSGTWFAAGLVFGLIWLPGLTRAFLWMTAAIGMAEVINAATEALSWRGQLNRTLTGQYLLSDRKHDGKVQIKSEEKTISS
ncbi:MAG: DUF1360 domain-containing protein [Anaerolineaceae bacterium]|nr:DUF1360 domain-containing protein [Anaerolineaceae bacterium]